MSETRKVVLPIDLDVMEATARALDWMVWANSTMNVASGMLPRVAEELPLVIQERDGYAIGFQRNTAGEVEAVYDDWKGKARASLDRIMPEYKAQAFIRSGTEAGFQVSDRSVIGNDIVLRLRRG